MRERKLTPFGLRALAACVAAPLLANATVALSASTSMSMEVQFMGMSVGTLNVTNYDASNTGTSASATVDGDFTKAAGAMVQAKLAAAAPMGMTYMQTVSVMFDSGKPLTNLRD